jgi:hypothetical protein
LRPEGRIHSGFYRVNGSLTSTGSTVDRGSIRQSVRQILEQALLDKSR